MIFRKTICDINLAGREEVAEVYFLSHPWIAVVTVPDADTYGYPAGEREW